ncbi:MAG: TolC family protein [Bacteroidales bacterium]|nr:TolC family protein [Bacteroidales bacterium]
MKKIFLFFLLPIAACQVSAESLSLDSCITMALQNNRQLVSSQKLAEKYKYEVKAYRANFFPNFKLMANDVWSNTEGTMNLQSAYLPTYSYNAATGSLIPNVLTDALGNVVMNGSTPVFNSYAYFPGVDIDYKIGNIFQAGLSLEQPLFMGGKIVTA